MSMSSSPDDVRGKVRIYARQRFDSASALLRAEQEAKTKAMEEDLGNRGFGFALDPLDSRFDDIQTWHCNAVLQAKADALFEAYEVYGLPIDDLIMKELNSHQRQMVDARASGLKSATTGRALRTGRNTAPGIARAEELGRKIERSTHAYMKSLACEVEKRIQMPKEMPKEASGPNVTINQQTIVGNQGQVAQATQLDSSSFSNTVSHAKGRDNVDRYFLIPLAVLGTIGTIIGLIIELHH